MQKNYRRCISCRLTAPKKSFLRVVRSYPGSQIQIGKGMGRSAYLCPNKNCLEVAQKKNRLRKSLRANIPEKIYSDLGKQ